MRLDAHNHFWKYSPEEFAWISDEMSYIRRDFLPEQLYAEQIRYGWEGSIAVQAAQTVAETEFLLSLAGSEPNIRGVVGWLDLCAPGIGEELDVWAPHPRLVGLRHVVQGEPDDQFMLRKDFMQGISLLERHGLTYDILIYPRHLPVALELVKQFPTQKFVIDHLAKPPIRAQEREPWARDLRAFKEQPHVFAKLSGLVTEADWAAWRPDDFRFYLDTAFEVFGPHRLMIGSDWPVCLLAGTYSEVMGIVPAYVSQLSEAEQAAVLGGTCAAFYAV
jgi:L-fuconolactonase